MKKSSVLLTECQDLDSIAIFFKTRDFEDVVKEKNNILVKLDNGSEVYLKIREGKNTKIKKSEFTTSIPYFLTVVNYDQFIFQKSDSIISDKTKTLKKIFVNSQMTPDEKKTLNEILIPNNISKFEKLFEENELDILVGGLNKIINKSVSKLSCDEERRLAASIGVDVPQIMNKFNSKEVDKKIKASAKRALLIIASAAMFHARLDPILKNTKSPIITKMEKKFLKKWPPSSVHMCYLKPNTVDSLLEAWQMILCIDYKPIFESGTVILNTLSGKEFNDIIKTIINWSKTSVTYGSGLKHDILGRLFHIMLDDAKNDGSFYTSIPAAVLLSGIALASKNTIPKELEKFKITDAACGTGTLLMASAERLKILLGGKYDEKKVIENVITGFDINKTALHMAATTLGLLSPTTFFEKMDIREAPFGRTPNGMSAGSLELYGKSGTFPLFGQTDQHNVKQVDTGKTVPSKSYAHKSDLVIMNPPFTRSDLRHDQLGEDETLIKKRETELFSSALIKVDKSSSGPMFIILAEHLVNAKGTVAIILPLTALVNTSTKIIRKFIVDKFNVETIVVPHDPIRNYFSESTTIPEILLILRKSKKTDTTLVSVSINPGNTEDATALIDKIINKKSDNTVKITSYPKELISTGDWNRVIFFSDYIIKIVEEIIGGELFNVQRLCDVAHISTEGGRPRDSFIQSETADADERMAIWSHETEEVTTIKQIPYVYITPNGDEGKAKITWSHRSTFLLPERLRTNLAHVAAIHSSVATIGTAWVSVVPFKKDITDVKQKEWDDTYDYGKKWSKAMSIYFNSTLGIVSLLFVSDLKAYEYKHWSIKNQQKITIPKLTDLQINELVNLYDTVKDDEIGTFSEYDDPTRVKIDKKVAKILGLDPKIINKLRLELSKEPQCTKKRYVS